jgi:ribosome-binding protein aMBF1 (putative translation factor)
MWRCLLCGFDVPLDDVTVVAAGVTICRDCWQRVSADEVVRRPGRRLIREIEREEPGLVSHRFGPEDIAALDRRLGLSAPGEAPEQGEGKE